MNEIIIHNTDGNATPCIADALKNLKADEENTIKFEKGRYEFFGAGTLEENFYPSNNSSGRKNVVFPILNIENLTVDGGNSEFVFCDRIFPFVIQGCKNITLKNFDIDFSFPRHCEASVLSSDERGFELFIDKKLFDYDIKNGNLLFRVGSYTFSTPPRKFFLNDLSGGAPVAYLIAGDTSEKLENLPAPVLRTDASITEKGVYFKYRDKSPTVIYKPGDTVFIGNDENRENDVIFAEFSENIRFENIRIFRGAGMGIIAQICTDIFIDNLKIMPKAERDKLLSVTADGLHFVNCDGKITVKNSVIEKTVDDALNMHGVYALVGEVLSDRSIRLRFGHPEQNGLIPFQPGDTAVVNDMKKCTEKGSAVIKEVSCNKDRTNIILTFCEDISGLINAGDALENPGRMAELEFTDNRILNVPNIRVSTCKKAVISDNEICNATIVVNDLYDYWYESGTVEDLEISDNTFTEEDRKLAIVIESCRRGEQMKKHKNITLKNNSFNNPFEEAVKAVAVENLIIRDNK